MIFNNKKTDIKAPVIEFFIRGVAVIKIQDVYKRQQL